MTAELVAASSKAVAIGKLLDAKNIPMLDAILFVAKVVGRVLLDTHTAIHHQGHQVIVKLLVEQKDTCANHVLQIHMDPCLVIESTIALVALVLQHLLLVQPVFSNVYYHAIQHVVTNTR